MSAFEILAEIALGVAGFGSIAIMLGQRASDWKAADEFRTSALFLGSFGALFMALLVIGLESAGLGEPTLWRASSAAILAQLVVGGSVMRWLRHRRLDPSMYFGPVLMALVWASVAVVAATLLASAIGWLSGPGAAYLGIAYMLAFACLMLVRIVFFRPAGE